ERFVTQVFDWTFDETIRGQDSAWVVARMLSNRESGPIVWKMVRTRWNDLLEAYPQVTVRHLFDGLPSLSHPEVAADVEAFFAETEVRSAKTLAQMLEILRVHVALRQREADRIGAALSA
ncbi:MAG: ERAP1-like C-terminal domain-containing protein, partial [Acidimicrobiia bacterium]|nr:ERAP1-like C-terminal domain-containing protein [Acidimicrobiia bacterium]